MRVKLGDVANESRETLRGGKRGLPVVGLEHLFPGELTLTAWDADGGNTFTKIFRKGQMLFGRRRAYLKKAAVAPFDGICSGDITVIEAVPNKILPELLPFIIQNDVFFDYAIGKSAGSLSPRVKWEHLSQFVFELPSLEEQRRLAELLWAANAVRESYKKLLAATDELVKSQFVEMFGDPVTNPMGWEVKRLGEVLRSKASNGFFAKNSDYSDNGDSRVMWVGDVVNRMYSNTFGLKRINATDKDISKYGVQYGDLLFCRSSLNVDGIGKASMVPTDVLPRTLFECHVIRTPLDISVCLPEFVQMLTTTDGFRNQILSKAKTVTMTTISQDGICSNKIYIPPLNLQNRFADFVRAADKSKFALQRALDELEATYKSILRENLV